MDKRFASILAVIVLAFVGFAVVSSKKSDTKSGGSKPQSSLVTNHVTGNLKSEVTLTEYGDYQCPFCEQYSTTLKQVVEVNKDKIRFQFRNFPLVSLHQNAFAAARAAEAASLQGKFWEMHDILYEQANWTVWTTSSSPTTYFNQYASQVGLDITKFKTDFSSDTINDTINADLEAGNKLGITGTPSFYLDGKQIQVTNDVAAFQKVIDAELAKKAKN